MGKTFSTGLLTNGIWQDASNNIGIGGSPSGSYKLEVTGTAKVSSTLLVSSTLTANDGTFSGSGVDGSLGSVVRISTTNTNGNARNWALVNTFDSYGDLNFRLSTAQGGNALTAGSTVLTLSRTGNALFTGQIKTSYAGQSISVDGGSTASVRMQLQNTSGNAGVCVENSTGGDLFTGTSAYSMAIGTFTEKNFHIGTNSVTRLTVTSVGNVGVGITGVYSDVKFMTRGVDATASNYAFRAETSAAANLMYIRNDGLIVTGLLSGSPYNYTTGSAANMYVSGGGELQRSTSSLKYKTDVKDYDKGLSEVLQMRPVYYKGKNDGDTQFAGLIAEEIHDLGLTEFVQYAEDGTPDALAYSNMVALLTKAIQELSAQNQDLKSRLDKAGL